MSRTNGKIAFLVVCWNNKAIIKECLDALIAQTYKNNTIYVIDNNSSDNTAAYIEKTFGDKVMLFSSDVNNGFARGNNILIAHALKDPDVSHIALINSDAVLDKNWAKEIMGFASTKTNIACVQGITLDYFDRGTVDAEHVYFGNNFQSVQYGYGEPFRTAFAYPRKVFGVNAAAAVYSREFVEEQPMHVLFDEKFYMYLEDVDVSFRSTITGWDNYYVPSARAYHMGSVSAKKRSNSYNIYMTFRNQTALIVKNLPVHTFFVFFTEFMRFERHFYRHLKRTQGSKVMWTAIKGRLVGIIRAPLYIGDRLRIQRRRNISSRELERVMRSKGIF